MCPACQSTSGGHYNHCVLLRENQENAVAVPRSTIRLTRSQIRELLSGRSIRLGDGMVVEPTP